MSNKELKRTLQALTEVRQELAGSDEKALAFLIKAGILTPDGEPVLAR